MEGRGRLAQSLTLKRRASFALWTRSYEPRWLRGARRWGIWLVNLKIPQGAGASAAAMLLLASVSYGAIKGGHGEQILENLQDLCDAAANKAGFRITEVALTGEHEVGRDEILTLAGISDHSSLLFLDAARARARLMNNPWISDATVLKLYPDRLRIEIKERKPFALWQKDGRIALIAGEGTVLETTAPPRFASLPMVVGKGAEYGAHAFLDLVRSFPEIAQATESSVLVAERRWNLHLKSGVEVLLPEIEPERALRILVRARPQQQVAVARHRPCRSAAVRPRHRPSVRWRGGRARAGAQGSGEGKEEAGQGRRSMTVLRFGLTPKMKPVSPRRAAVVAGLDIGTSKVVCLIARLEPQAPQDVLRRRSHGVSLLAFAHTAASGMKGGSVVDLVEAEETVRQAIDIAESMAGVQLQSVVVSMSGGRLGSERFVANIDLAGGSVTGREYRPCAGSRQPSFGARRARRPAFPADRLCRRCRHRHPRAARHARPASSASICTWSPRMCRRCKT